jgi:hypothetical protein
MAEDESMGVTVRWTQHAGFVTHRRLGPEIPFRRGPGFGSQRLLSSVLDDGVLIEADEDPTGCTYRNSWSH